MITQIGEVLATYWRRAISSPFAMVAVGLLVFGTVGPPLLLLSGDEEGSFLERKQLFMMMTWMAMLGFYAPALIAVHFKQQFVQIRQRRIPHAATTHVIAVVGFLFLCAVGFPAAIMSIGTWSWGALGFLVAVTALSFAYFVVVTRLFILTIIPLVFMACFDSVQKWLEQLWLGRHEAFGLPLMVAGVCGIATTLAWLLQMSEENPAYFIVLDVLDTGSCPLSMPSVHDAQPRKAFWQSLLPQFTPSQRQVQLWPQWAQGSLWQRIRLWNAGSSDLSPLWFAAFYLALFSFGYVMVSSSSVRTTAMIFNALYMTFCPVYTVTSTMSQRRQIATIELLRPVKRSRFFFEVGLAYAYRVPLTWVLFSISWCVPAYLFASDAPAWSRQMVNLLVLTAGFQVFYFGLAVWVMRYAVPSVTWLVLCLGIFFVMMLGVIMASPFIDWRNASLNALCWVTPGVVIAGLLMTWDAYRRWMHTEMG